MAENKTKATSASVSDFVGKIKDSAQRDDAKALIKMMETASGEKPKMWGPSIVGFGAYHYKYDTGREGDMPLICFSPRKGATVLYSLLGSKEAPALLPKLGKHKTSGSCLHIKKLSDVDAKVLNALITKGLAHMKKQHAS